MKIKNNAVLFYAGVGLLAGFIIGGFTPLQQVFHAVTVKKIDFHPSSFLKTEVEPDNTFNQAIQLQPGIEITGNITGKDDRDFYKINLSGSSLIKGELSNLPDESEMLIYDSNKKLIASSKRTGIINSTFTVLGEMKGTYYLVLHGKSTDVSRGQYSFSVSLIPLED